MCGPRILTAAQEINWTRVDGIKISGISTPTSIGLNLDNSQPLTANGAGKGSNYNGSFSNILIENVAVGVKIGALCNTHTFSSIFFYQITKYSDQSTGNSENTFFGGFTHLSHDITVIKLEDVKWNLFYGVQAEPGGISTYFDVDETSEYCQIIGHDNCANGPINHSKALTYLSHGLLGLVNVAFASKQFDINDKDPPDMGEYQRLIRAGIFSINKDASKHEVTFFPHKSEWSKYYIVISGTFESLVVGNTVTNTNWPHSWYPIIPRIRKQAVHSCDC